MFKQIKQLFSVFDEQQPSMQEHDLKTAVAALLIEVMRADAKLDDDEQHTLTTTLKRYFALNDADVNELLNNANRGRQIIFSFQNKLTNIVVLCSALK